MLLSLGAHLKVRGTAVACALSLRCDDLKLHAGPDALMNFCFYLVLTGGLDQVLRENDGTLVQVRAAGCLACCDEVVSLHGTEQLTALGGADCNLDTLKCLKLSLNFASMVEVANAASLLGTLDALDLLLSARGSRNGQATREQQVTSVAVLDLYDVASDTKILNGGGEDQQQDPSGMAGGVESLAVRTGGQDHIAQHCTQKAAKGYGNGGIQR